MTYEEAASLVISRMKVEAVEEEEKAIATVDHRRRSTARGMRLALMVFEERMAELTRGEGRSE